MGVYRCMDAYMCVRLGLNVFVYVHMDVHMCMDAYMCGTYGCVYVYERVYEGVPMGVFGCMDAYMCMGERERNLVVRVFVCVSVTVSNSFIISYKGDLTTFRATAACDTLSHDPFIRYKYLPAFFAPQNLILINFWKMPFFLSHSLSLHYLSIYLWRSLSLFLILSLSIFGVLSNTNTVVLHLFVAL